MPLLGPVGGLATDFNDLVTTLGWIKRERRDGRDPQEGCASRASIVLMRALYNVGDFEATFDFEGPRALFL